MKILTPIECVTLVSVCSSGHEEGVRQILNLKQKKSVKFSENAVIYYRNTKYTLARCLKIAAGNGFIRIVKMLLADSRMYGVRGHQEAFRIAVTWGRMEVVKVLFKHPRVNPAAYNNLALYTAVNAEHSEAIRLLLSHEKVLKGPFNSKLLYWAIKNNEEALVEYILKSKTIDPCWNKNAPLKAAIELGNPRIVYMLMRNKNIHFGVDGNSAIIQASALGHLEVVDLLRTRDDVNPADRKNYAIHLAAINGHVEVVRLLQQDARVSAFQYEGDLTLLRVIRGMHYEVAKVLLATDDFDPRVQNHLLLKWAIYHQDTTLLKLLLSYHYSKKRIDPAFDRNWAIRTAAAIGNIDHIKLLVLDKDVNPGALDNEALLNACVNGHPAIVQLLLNLPKVKLDNRYSEPMSEVFANQTEAMFRSTNDESSAHVEIVQILLRNKQLNPGCKNNAILKLTAHNGFAKVFELLVGSRHIPHTVLYDAFKLSLSGNHIAVIQTLFQHRPDFKSYLEQNPSLLVNESIFNQGPISQNELRSIKTIHKCNLKRMQTICFLLGTLNVPFQTFALPTVISANDAFKVVKLKGCQEFIAVYQACLAYIAKAKEKGHDNPNFNEVLTLHEQDMNREIQTMIGLIAEKLTELRQVIFFVNAPVPNLSLTPVFTQVRRFGLDRHNSSHVNLPDNVLNKIMKYMVDGNRIGVDAHEKIEMAIEAQVSRMKP